MKTRVLRSTPWLAPLMAASLALAACSSSADPARQTKGEPTGTLKFIVSSSESSDAAFRAINKAFMEKYPDVKVEFSAIPNENWASTNSSRLAAGNVDLTLAGPQEVPDYVPESSTGDDALAADAGVYTDLTDEPFLKRFKPSVLAETEYKDKQFAVPTGASYYTGVYYNKAIFEKYDLSVPATWDEFVKLCQTLQDNGVTPLGIGGKDGWPAGLTMIAAVQGLYPTAEDKAELAQDLWTQKVELTDPKPVEVLERVQTMYDFAQENFSGVSYSAIPAGFANESFAMTPDGTWSEPTIAAAVGDRFDFGYFPIPTSDSASDNKLLGGKVELTLAVPSHAENPNAALAYLDFFSEPENYRKFVEISGFASAQPGIPASPFLESISDYTETFSPAWDTQWYSNPDAGSAAAFPFDYMDLAPLGEATAEEAAAKSQQDWATAF